ncbi:MAG: ATP-binding cassette domain-containing protein, partial [Bacteroidota bacterium]
MGFYQKIPPKMNEIIVGIGIMILFLFAVLFPAYQTDLLLILGGFGLAAFKIMPSINRMMYSLILIKNVSYVISELKSIKNIKIQAFQEVSPLTFEKELAFKNISYQYPSSSNKVIKELSFTIKKGETVGFIGESGAGKSTLLNLILRFVTETSGNVEIDGVKLVSELGPNYQKLIGYVPQEVFIKEGTLRENIAFGDNTEDIDDKSILKAVKDAAMLDFVNNHPDGLDMQLGENGADLSGGQKQRIGIARVIYQDAPIMVFDEITSALDKDTEKSIIETIGQLANQNKTIIIVAHRLSTLEMANRIYELNNGEIANIYQFKELATLN